ncbi:hypothetical protein [Streptomyces sp. NPDC008150]|uniref:hypothetical protein n=1 Tax=Streptomyces sp. NPDC008150 TaxID=3364816 RepID=UPI0036E9CFC6
MPDNTIRVVRHDAEDDSSTILVVNRTPETDAMSDDQLITRYEQWQDQRPPLRPVDEPE